MTSALLALGACDGVGQAPGGGDSAGRSALAPTDTGRAELRVAVLPPAGVADTSRKLLAKALQDSAPSTWTIQQASALFSCTDAVHRVVQARWPGAGYRLARVDHLQAAGGNREQVVVGLHLTVDDTRRVEDAGVVCGAGPTGRGSARLVNEVADP